MNGIPSLPSDRLLRALAVSGSVSLFLFAAAFIVALWTGRRRQALWPFAVVALAFGTGALGRLAYSELHYAGVFLTVGTAIAGARATRGAQRTLLVLGTGAWLIATGLARALFH